ncbi:MAG: SelB C-terminal domain-containing protein, partial [Candidatus Promineifilaceae bacterium]
PVKLQQNVGLDSAEFQTILTQLSSDRQVVQLGKQLVTISTVNEWGNRIEAWLHAFHHTQPLRLGMSREEIRSRLKLKAVVFNPIIGRMVEQALITEADALLHLPEHTVAFSNKQQANIDQLMRQFAKSGISAPSVKACQTLIGNDVYQALLDLDQIVQVSKDVVWRRTDYEAFIKQVIEHLCQHKSISAGDARDLFQTSRKYAIGLLEHLDKIQITRRNGDKRELMRRGLCGDEE